MEDDQAHQRDLSSRDAALRLGISVRSLRRLVRRGTLGPSKRTGAGHLRFAPRDLDRMAPALAVPHQTVARAALLEQVMVFVFDQQGAITLTEGHALDALPLLDSLLTGQSIFTAYCTDPDLLANARRALHGE